MDRVSFFHLLPLTALWLSAVACSDDEMCSFEEPAAIVEVTSTEGQPLNVRALVQVDGGPADTVTCSDGQCRWFGNEGAALTFTITVGDCTEVAELTGQGGDSCTPASAARASVSFDLDACITE